MLVKTQLSFSAEQNLATKSDQGNLAQSVATSNNLVIAVTVNSCKQF